MISINILSVIVRIFACLSALWYAKHNKSNIMTVFKVAHNIVTTPRNITTVGHNITRGGHNIMGNFKDSRNITFVTFGVPYELVANQL